MAKGNCYFRSADAPHYYHGRTSAISARRAGLNTMPDRRYATPDDFLHRLLHPGRVAAAATGGATRPALGLAAAGVAAGAAPAAAAALATRHAQHCAAGLG